MDRGCFFLLGLLLIVLSVTSCGGGGSNDNTEDQIDSSIPIDPGQISYSKLSNLNTVFTINYPSGWENSIDLPEDFEGIEVLADFFEDLEGPTDRFYENIVLVTGDLNQNFVPSPELSDFEITSQSIETLGSHPAEIETGKFSVQSGSETLFLSYMEITIDINGQLFGLQYLAETRRFSTYIEIAKKMVEGWIFGFLIEPAIFDQTLLEWVDNGTPSIANNGSEYIVAYCRPSPRFRGPIVAKIISQVGVLLHEVEIDGGDNFCSSSKPKVAFDGINYLVTYVAKESLRTVVAAKRLSTSGHLIDSNPIVVSELIGYGDAKAHDLTFDGTRYMATWYEKYRQTHLSGPYTNRMAATFINTDGTVEPQLTIADFGTDPMSIADTDVYIPKILASQSSILVSWYKESDKTVRAKFIDFSGNIITPTLITDPFDTNKTGIPDMQLSTNYSSHLVSWANRDEPQGVVGWNVANDGSIIDATIDNKPRLLAATSQRESTLLHSELVEGEYEFVFSNTEGIFTFSTNSDLDQVTLVEKIQLDVTEDESLRYFTKSSIDIKNSVFVFSPGRGGIIGWFE